MEQQNFKNHSRIIPLYHLILFAGILVVFIASVYKFIRNYQLQLGGIMIPALLIIISVLMLLLAWYTRVFSLKAQDRAIRAEENFRHYVLTGKLFDSRLKITQIIALRFAPDNEFAELAKKAAEENMKPVEIKKAIQQWKGDYYRV